MFHADERLTPLEKNLAQLAHHARARAEVYEGCL